MFRIRTLPDAVAPANIRAIAEIQTIIREQFPDMPLRDIEKIPELIKDPVAHEFASRVMAAEDGRGRIRGFAILLMDSALRFGYLELVSTGKRETGGGVGAALYHRVRETAKASGLEGVYFECLPDDPKLSPNPDIRERNASRLKFYERFGAYPIMGAAYETPMEPGASDSPYLVFDGLGQFALPKAAKLRKIVRAILERKYAHLCPPDYVDGLVKSIQDNAIKLRAPRYVKTAPATAGAAPSGKFPLIVNEKHDIHHIRERGYVEAPARVRSILDEIETTQLFERVEPKKFTDRYITAVHDPKMAAYIERACADAPEGKSVYPYVFPIRNAHRAPKDRSVLAGYWCIDTFTPLNGNAYLAARRGVDCALTAAETVLNGAQAAYALVRPPGHHAERKAFGGFCYFNNAAIAAHYLSEFGRVAVLDVDYHHGNGTQDIFYERDDVLTVSIHGHPNIAYPYFSGFKDETGRGAGAGFNLNIPLPETIRPDDHRQALKYALSRIAEFDPAYLIVALGLDVAKGDPTGTWPYRSDDFARMGELIGAAGLSAVIIQEGGYRIQNLGLNARRFFEGFAGADRPAAAIKNGRAAPKQPARNAPTRWRDAICAADAAEIRRIVIAAGVFSPEEIAIAEELAVERIQKGRASTYQFILANRGRRLAGYASFGKTPGTEKIFDLYWLAVDPIHQQTGLGREILRRVEQAVLSSGGASLIAETSSTAPYEKARRFYLSAGFCVAADLPNFYRDGDGKLIFRKEISDERPAEN